MYTFYINCTYAVFLLRFLRYRRSASGEFPERNDFVAVKCAGLLFSEFYAVMNHADIVYNLVLFETGQDENLITLPWSDENSSASQSREEGAKIFDL